MFRQVKACAPLALALLLGCHRPPTVTAVDLGDLAIDVPMAAAAPDAGAPEDVAEDLPLPPPAAPEPPPGRSTLDLPLREAWPAVNEWNDRMEAEYSAFIARLGAAVAQRRCRRLDQCLREPSANALFDAASDRRLALTVDCADLPYILRAYFAFKRRLPFGYVARVRGQGDDPRYMLGVRPARWRAWTDFRTARAVMRAMVDDVHSGMYRVSPEVPGGDLYPPRIDRDGVRPGTAYYDPNGHVLVVIEVRPDGAVYLIDGHPDGSLTYKRFGEAFAIGTRRLGGGFQNFRPLRWDGAHLTRSGNAELPGFDGESQWSPAAWQPAVPDADAGARPPRVTYHQWVRQRLAAADAVLDPVLDLREQVASLCRDVADRAEAVDAAVAAGVHRQAHPAALPWNIYGTTGDWETWSTPSRDARLKAAVRELHSAVVARSGDPALLARLRDAWREESARPGCVTRYANSAGAAVTLPLDSVLDRLFALSFDPYHCVELRWGAPSGSAELATCPDDPARRGWYRAEQRLRQQIDRNYGVATPLDAGPEAAPEVDPRRPLGLRP
ncbi:MAG: hypothetical protein Q8S73_04915 [Deltaproteobacteria bacterium]|nr:hypothetical protein [Myxococcales bacterium]MDP3213420.1 hypothetical protein [Deltaproteobacteria bacterium]